jgi:hypothetical protein
MEFDEWSTEQFETWRGRDDISASLTSSSFSGLDPHLPAGDPVPFPEVVIGSSSDDEAPPVPESTQLARENLQLRARVNALVAQSKSLEQTNDTLKTQLHKCRTSFASQVKSKFKSLFH